MEYSTRNSLPKHKVLAAFFFRYTDEIFVLTNGYFLISLTPGQIESLSHSVFPSTKSPQGNYPKTQAQGQMNYELL